MIGLLRQKGGIVEYRDPYIRHIHHETDGWYMDSVQDVMQSVRDADAVVIITNHKVYDYQAIVENSFRLRQPQRDSCSCAETDNVVRL